jgi:hypothetical protein
MTTTWKEPDMRKLIVSGLAALAAMTVTAEAGAAVVGSADRQNRVVVADTGWGNPACPLGAWNCPTVGTHH